MLDGAVASLKSVLVQARASDEATKREANDDPSTVEFAAPLTDSFGELALSVAATADGLRMHRSGAAASEVPPPLGWPLDELIDDSELGNWSADGLLVDLSELHTYSAFYRREYNLELDERFAAYRRVWNEWARVQQRVQESSALYDDLRELTETVSARGQSVETLLVAWRLIIPGQGVDLHIALRPVRLEKTTVSRSPNGADEDQDIPGAVTSGVSLIVHPAEPTVFELGPTGLVSADNVPLTVRSSVVERNDLPIGAQVRGRVIADIRPAIAEAIDRQWGKGVDWSLTLSPALLVRGRRAASERADLEQLRLSLTDILAPWPGVEQRAMAEISEATRGDWASAIERRLEDLLRAGQSAPDGVEVLQNPHMAEPQNSTAYRPKFRDRLRARTEPTDPLTRFRDRRRAAAESSLASATDGVEAAPRSLELDSGHGPMELDLLQRAVVEAAPASRLVVIAGAGQGKTEVVAARLGLLASEFDLSLSTEVLVLSFSRAAVSAVRSRLQTRVLARAEIRTFDSFANRVIIDAGEEPKGSFDSRIDRAVTLLLDGDSELPILDDIQHVILDEVQDLVGRRAELALALIGRLGDDVGFTALGDPNQALYDFQLSPQEREKRTDVFGELSGLDTVEVVGLQRNFRARGSVPLSVVALGPRLREIKEGATARTEVDSFIQGIAAVESSVWLDAVYAAGRSTAVLTKTNGDALRVSQQLTAIGIRHSLRRTAQELGAAPWIAELAHSLRRNTNRREDVMEALHTTSVANPADAWNLLKEAEGRTQFPNDLDLSRVRRVIGGYGIPTALLADSTEDVVVSTVHRAKGLEFDRVFLYDTDYESDDDDFAIARRNYVALSRARDEIVRCTPKKSRSWMKKDSGRTGRWTEQGYGTRGKTRVRAVELRVEDVDSDEPFEIDGDAAEVQRLLASGSPAGRTVSLELDVELTHRDAPIYFVKGLDGVPFARTTENFGRELRRIFTIGSARWPMVLNGGTATSIESVVGSPEISEDAGLGESGIWLVPRLAGLLQPDWTTKWDGKN